MLRTKKYNLTALSKKLTFIKIHSISVNFIVENHFNHGHEPYIYIKKIIKKIVNFLKLKIVIFCNFFIINYQLIFQSI